MPKKLTTAEWIEKAKAKHGDRYEYSEAVYTRAHEKLTIICREHGPFQQIARDHTNSGVGCSRCSGRYSPTTEEWIESAREVHGDRYDYSSVTYQNSKRKITIICREHGPFRQSPDSHLQGNGCCRCSGQYSPSTEEWVAKAREVHGDRYDYSGTVYTGSHEKLTIICREHGEFTQNPQKHVLSRQGCPKCSPCYNPTTEEWIAKARARHGEKFDYSQVVYKNADSPVVIICPDHGEFEQTPWCHMTSDYGCSRCGKAATTTALSLTTEKWIERAREMHGDRYEYSSVKYESGCAKVRIICRDHGEFEQDAWNHLSGSGCPRCSGLYSPTTEEWIERARAVHGDLYGYELVEYKNQRTPVVIVCRQDDHGVFHQLPGTHTIGGGCPRCAGHYNPTTEEWIELARAVHKDRFDYSSTT